MFHDLPAQGDLSAATGGFDTTQWTLLESVRAEDTKTAEEALARLCTAYWNPLYSFIRRQGSTPPEAEDLTQQFFCRLLERDIFTRVQRGSGKFRSFLLTCLKNFLANERERVCAQRRGGGCALMPLDTDIAETQYSLEPGDHLTPEAIFDRHWAFVLLERTMSELRREYCSGERRQQFEDLEGFLPGGRPGASRAELAAKRGVSPGAIDVAIHRLRQRFGTLLREQVARTVSSEGEVEDELRYLISVVGT